MREAIGETGVQLRREIKKIVARHSTFALFSHEVPDGDAIGSQVALALALRSLGKEVVSLRYDGIPETFAFLNHSGAIGNYRPGRDRARALAAKATFILDASGYDRLGDFSALLRESRSRIVNIDHHRDNTFFGDLNYVRFQAGGTAELVFEIVRELGVPVRGTIADALYVGISTDALGFKWIDPEGNLIFIVGELVRAGIDIEDLQERLYYTMPDNYLADLARMIRGVSYGNGGRLAWFTVPRGGDLSYYQRELATETLHQLMCMKKTLVAAMFHELRSGVEVWLRSKTIVDVGKAAKHLGGGGHRTAAGALMRGMEMGRARRAALACARKAIRKAARGS